MKACKSTDLIQVLSSRYLHFLECTNSKGWDRSVKGGKSNALKKRKRAVKVPKSEQEAEDKSVCAQKGVWIETQL